MYTIIIRNCWSTVGSEALSFISYARKSTDLPREVFRGKQIAEELYESPIPSGLLPFDMPTTLFVEIAEDRLRTLPNHRHIPCSLFKTQLLEVMSSKFNNEPKFRLIYARTLVEIALHEFIVSEGVGRKGQFSCIME